MLPLLLFAFVAMTLWLLDYGLPQFLSGAAAPHLASDLAAIAGGAVLVGLVMPWAHVWRRFVRQRAERWR
jgi:hypothetical protein